MRPPEFESQVDTASESDAIEAGIQRGLRWTAIRQIVTSLAGTVGVFFYARFITPEAMGAASLALLVYEGMYLLIRVPISHAVVFYQDEADHPSAAFWLLMAFSIPATVLMIWAAPYFGAFYRSAEAGALTQMVIVAFFMLSLATVPSALLIQQMRFNLYEGFMTIYQLLGMVGWIVLSVLGFGAWSLILPTLFAAVFWVSAVWTAVRFRPKFNVPRRAFAEIFKFARSLWGSELLTYLMRKMDNAAVGTLGEGPLGLYAFGEDQSSFATLSVAAVIGNVALPALAKVQHQIEEFQRIYVEMLRLTAAASLPMQVGGIIIADQLLVLFFGNQWEGAVAIFRVYVLFQMFECLTVLSNVAMSASGRPQLRLRMNLLQLPLFIAATWFGLRVWGGVLGVAVALAIVRSAASMLYLAITWRVLKLPARVAIRALMPSLIAASVMGIAAWGIRLIGPEQAIPSIIVTVISAIAIYGVLLWRIDRVAFVQMWHTAAQIFIPASMQARILHAFRCIPILRRLRFAPESAEPQSSHASPDVSHLQL